MRPSTRPNARNRSRSFIGRNLPRNGSIPEATRGAGTHQNVRRLLTERSEQISRLESDYRNYEQRGAMMSEEISRLDAEYREQQSRARVSEDNKSTRAERDVASDCEPSRAIDQASLHEVSLRKNASHVELLIEREGRIIQTVSWEAIQNTPPLPKYATQRAQPPHRHNVPYYDGEIRALTIVERLRNNNSIHPGDRIIIRGPTAPCADCQYNVRNYAVEHNLDIAGEYPGPQVVFNARQAAPERNLSNFYGRGQDVDIIRAPYGGLFHRVNYNNPDLRIPRGQNELGRQLRGRDVRGNEGRVVSGVLRNPPREVVERPMDAVIDPVAPAEEILNRFFGSMK
jgi:hypothetical protein